MQEQVRKLRGLVRRRDDVLALAAHSLRNPLHVLCLQLTLVRALAETDGRRDLAGHVDKAQRPLLRSTERFNVLLKLANPSASGYPLNRQSVDLRETLALLAKASGAEAESRGVALQLDMPEPCRTVTDAGVVSQIVDNLLLNAFKHAGCTRVRIALRATAGVVLNTVSDDGQGIAIENQQRVTGPAGDVEPKLNTGLGLWIVRTLSAALGSGIFAAQQPQCRAKARAIGLGLRCRSR